MTQPRHGSTINDVADAAGVSVATVSRVINNRYGVAADTVARVQAVIQELGYESSLVARSLRSRRTNVIGVIINDLEPFSIELLKGVADATRSSEYDLIVYSAAGHADIEHGGWERRLLARLNGSLTDGTILVTPTVVEASTTSPVVTIDPHVGAVSLPAVDSNNFEGAVKAMAYLLELGHRRIGFIGGRPDLESARLRREGYMRGLEQAGIALDPDLVKTGDYTREVALHRARELLGLERRPTAIFASNDQSAIGSFQAARELGLGVPDDVSVIGFDNVPEAALTDPPLTTIDQSVRQMGFEATRLLIDQINGTSSDSVHLTLPTELVIRRSCRAVETIG